MTNGEKLKEVFPSIKLYEKSHDAIQINFDSVWWSAEYKDPTTKNDLANDVPDINVGKIDSTTKNCESCKYYGSHHEVCNYCYKCSLWTEKEPTTKNDLRVDCISRADAIKAMQDKAKKLKNEDTINGLCGAVAILFDMPSVTPQPRKGHWIVQPSNKEQGERDFIWWKCSECGQVIFSETLHDRLEFHAFCGRCGAKMESEVEE